MKVAFNIYLRHLNKNDITNTDMDVIINTLKTEAYHETKFFFLHQHFDLLTVKQMNNLIDVLMEILDIKDVKRNPVIHQYNTIKYALLIFRVSWKVEEKKIYSLITKVSLLNQYLLSSLEKYFTRLTHISHLYNLMCEPVLHMSLRMDSLDIMLEMQMDKLLKNPVVVEVLNLVYEGQYSYESSALYLSETF